MGEGKYIHCQYPSVKWRRRARLTLAKYRLWAPDVLAEFSHYNLQISNPGRRWVGALSTKSWTDCMLYSVLVMTVASLLTQIKNRSILGPDVSHKQWWKDTVCAVNKTKKPQYYSWGTINDKPDRSEHIDEHFLGNLAKGRFNKTLEEWLCSFQVAPGGKPTLFKF